MRGELSDAVAGVHRQAGGQARLGQLPSHLAVLRDLLRLLGSAVAEQQGLSGDGGPAGFIPPLPVLGVFGDWGTGKSTLLRWCGQVLEAEEWPVIRFEAWRHQGDADPMVALLEELYGWAEGRATLRARITRFLQKWEKVAAAGLFSVLGLITKATAGADLSTPLEAMAAAGEGIGIPRSEHRKLRRELATLLGAVREAQSDRPLVILVDDLDRCLPDQAWRVLETLRVHFLSPDVACVLALEPDIIASHIERIYGTGAGDGRPVVDGQRFLDRVVSHSFRLRPLKIAGINDRLQDAPEARYDGALLGAVLGTKALEDVSWVPRIWIQLLNHLEHSGVNFDANEPVPHHVLARCLLGVFRDVAAPLTTAELDAIQLQLAEGQSVPLETLFEYDEDRWQRRGRLSELLNVLDKLGIVVP